MTQARNVALCAAAWVTASLTYLLFDIETLPRGPTQASNDAVSEDTEAISGAALFQTAARFKAEVKDPISELDDSFDERVAQPAEWSKWDVLAPTLIMTAFQDSLLFVIAVSSFFFWRAIHTKIIGNTEDTEGSTTGTSTSLPAEMKTSKETAGTKDTFKRSCKRRLSGLWRQEGQLMTIMRSGDEEALLKFLNAKPVDTSDSVWGCTALHVAAHCNSLTAAKRLLERGANANAEDSWEETPLHFAARSGSVEVCQALLSCSAEVNVMNSEGWTPLLVAGAAGKEEICKLLQNNGAKAGSRTPAHIESRSSPFLPDSIRKRCVDVPAGKRDM